MRNLPTAFQKFKKEGNLEVGLVVLIREDGLPRLRWAISLVEKLQKGKDGTLRSDDLRTSHRCRTRAVQWLYSLEIINAEEPPKRDIPSTRLIIFLLQLMLIALIMVELLSVIMVDQFIIERPLLSLRILYLTSEVKVC